jgi:hypothetical protein
LREEGRYIHEHGLEFVGWCGGSVCTCVRDRTCMSVYAWVCVRQARNTFCAC